MSIQTIKFLFPQIFLNTHRLCQCCEHSKCADIQCGSIRQCRRMRILYTVRYCAERGAPVPWYAPQTWVLRTKRVGSTWAYIGYIDRICIRRKGLSDSRKGFVYTHLPKRWSVIRSGDAVLYRHLLPWHPCSWHCYVYNSTEAADRMCIWIIRQKASAQSEQMLFVDMNRILGTVLTGYYFYILFSWSIMFPP